MTSDTAATEGKPGVSVYEMTDEDIHYKALVVCPVRICTWRASTAYSDPQVDDDLRAELAKHGRTEHRWGPNEDRDLLPKLVKHVR